MRASLIIVGFFVLGIVSGVFHVLPEGWVTDEACMGLLLSLMLAIGIGMGSGDRLRAILRSLSPRLLLFPLATTVGTFLGAAACALVLTWSVWQCLAVGAGFAYYSLSSVLISQAGHLELGTVALISNILREAIALVLIPFAVKFLPGHAVISMAGCTTMDTTFPVLVRTLGMDWAFVCILHAIVLDFSVPFWVAFYCSLF
ncbi:MAG: lysine exporter LysO family protein [Desulfovibrio sp.]|nr:lysine exporter LysO family protein [Desulfovibrio sp.]